MTRRLSDTMTGFGTKVPAGRSVLDLARDRTAYLFDNFDHVVVSHSGGKDSCIACELAVEEARKRGKLPLEVVFCDEEINYPETRAFFERMQQREEIRLRWLCWPWEWRNSVTRTWWWSWDPRAMDRWVFDLPEGADAAPPPGWRPKPMQDSMDHVFPMHEYGTVALIVGLRSDESPARTFAILHREFESWLCPNSNTRESRYVWLCKTIYDWKTPDVWTAMAENEWDYNGTYDLMQRYGTPLPEQRIAQPFHDEGLKQIPMFAEMFPEWWDRVLRRLPQAATAARYARSPLFAHRGTFDKPEDRTWRELIAEALVHWQPRERRKIIANLRRLIETHKRESGGLPIPEDNPDLSPCGVTWRMMLGIVMKGQLKDRNDAIPYGKSGWRRAAKEQWKRAR